MQEKIEASHKTSLLLDLDKTVFVALNESEYKRYGDTYKKIKDNSKIHISHDLSSGVQIRFTENGVFVENYYFFVINPQELKTMIEQVYAQGHDIIIFTSGLWSAALLGTIGRLCGLSGETADKFANSLFLEPVEDSNDLGCSVEEASLLVKGQRLEGLFKTREILRNRKFVLLDDNANHIGSCQKYTYLTGVRATTDEAGKGFYEEVIGALKSAHSNTKAPSPAKANHDSSSEVSLPLAELQEQMQSLGMK